MNIKKKLISILATFSMVAAIVPSGMVSASYISDVKPMGLSLSGTATNYYSSSDVTHSGNYSVYFGTDGTSYDKTSLVFPLKYDLTANESYRLSFYTYRTTTNNGGGGRGGRVYLSNDQVLPQSTMTFYKSDDVTVATNHTEWGGNYQLTQTDEDNVWGRTVVDFVPTADVSSFRFTCWEESRYYDDICVQKLVNGVPTGENLVINANMETVLDYNDPYAKYPSNWIGMINKKNDSSTDFTNNNGITSTDADAHSGNRSMLINIDASLSANITMHTTVNLPEALKANTKYKLVYWHKKSTGGNHNPMYSGLATYSTATINWNLWTDRANMVYSTVENGWRKQEYTFTNSEERYTIGFTFWDPTCVMLDDIQIFELDASGNTVKELVVPNGDFEDYLDFNSNPVGIRYNNSWTVGLNGISDGSAEDYVRYVNKGNGDYALHIKYYERSAANTYVNVKSTAGEMLEAGETYTLEYDTKYGASLEQETIQLFPSAAFDYSTYINYHDLSYLPKSESVTYENGWYHVKKNFTVSSAKQQQIYMLVGAAGDLMIDNIQVYKTSDSSKTNLVVDGDFSDTVEILPMECNYSYAASNTNWTLRFNNMTGDVEDYAHVEDIGDGNYAMHLQYYDDVAGNVYARLTSKASDALVSGKNYIVEFDARYNSVSSDESLVIFPFANWDWDATIKNSSVTSEFTMGDDGWYHYSKEFTSTESVNQNLNIIIQSKCDAFIDNIKIYAADDQSKTNLVIDGDFQDTLSGEKVHEEAFDETQVYAEIECELYYDSESENTNAVAFEGEGDNGAIFRMNKDALILGEATTAMEVSTGWYKLNAVMDYDNTMRVTVTLPDGGIIERAENSYFNSSTGINKIIVFSKEGNYKNISVSTDKPEQEPEKERIKAEIVSITKDGSEVMGITQLSAADDTVINIDYLNNTGNKQDLTVIAAYYDTDEKLVGVETVAKETVSGETAESTLSYPYTIASVTNADKLVFFAWDSLGGMKPLGERYLVGDTRFSDTQLYHVTTTFYGDEGTTRGFAWSTVTEHDDMVIQYAKSSQNWNTSMIQKSATYEEYNSINFHKADIDGLEPGETYVYRVGDTVDDLWSDYYTFTTEPENVESFSFIGITDTQCSTWEDGYTYMKKTLDKAIEDAPDAAFTVNVGDLTDAGDSRTQWRYYFNAAEGYAESIPHMAVVGNHCCAGDENSAGKLFQLHFNNPTNGYDALGDLTVDDVSSYATKGVINNFEGSVYSFDYGNAHFVVLNSGPLVEAGTKTLLAKQAEWLREDLNASDKKWKIVMVHMSLYPALERYDTKEPLLDVIDECGVDLVLHGHDHMVTRTYPMKNDEIVTKSNINTIEKGIGTVYNILGCGGPKRYGAATNTKEYAAILDATKSSQPTYSVFSIDGDSIDVITKQINGTVIDEYTIVDTEN